LSFEAYAAVGVNSTPGNDLPMGASDNIFLYLMKTKKVLFGPTANEDEANAWIDTTNGKAFFKGAVTFGNGVNVTGGGLVVNNIIQSGDIANGGTGGLYVGPGEFFGSVDPDFFGLRFNDTWGLVMRSSGNIGIGTLTPSTRLDVNGTMNVEGDLKVDTLTIPGTELKESLDARKMDNIISISNLEACTGPGVVVLKKTGEYTYSCETVTAGSFAYNGTYMCDSGKYVIGFENGVPKCGTP
jgi:hypothetical protein